MPVFKSGLGLAPAWCELTYFEIVELQTGARHTFDWIGNKEKLIVGKGRCRLSVAGQVMELETGAQLDLRAAEEEPALVEVLTDTTLVRMCGQWRHELGGSGLFTVSRSDTPRDTGDPVAYPKTTNFDCHYHDCDEYWILFEGAGTAVSEGKSYQVGAGDCVATGMGHHHDFPDVTERVQAVYFETTLAGQKRRGHLWDHTHGHAQPQPERV
ncbi:MAG TPA: hypothetical protein VEZ12_15565 [Herpetosiphonaceae bacterium]|nr:hypothetical protein [Herpetosiphonaceae bacterium]